MRIRIRPKPPKPKGAKPKVKPGVATSIAAAVRMATTVNDWEIEDSAEEEDAFSEVAGEPEENEDAGGQTLLGGEEGNLGPSDVEWSGSLPLVYQLPRSARPPVYFFIDKRYQVYEAAGTGLHVSPLRKAIAWAIAQHIEDNNISLDESGAWRDIPYIGNDAELRKKAIKHWEVRCNSLGNEIDRSLAHFILNALNRHAEHDAEGVSALTDSLESADSSTTTTRKGDLAVDLRKFLGRYPLSHALGTTHSLLEVLSPALERIKELGLLSSWSVDSVESWKLRITPYHEFVSSRKLDQGLNKYGAEYKSFAIILPNGDVIVPQALIYCAGKKRRATRAGALRALADAKAHKAPPPKELVGEAWTKKHWQSFEKAQRQSKRKPARQPARKKKSAKV